MTTRYLPEQLKICMLYKRSQHTYVGNKNAFCLSFIYPPLFNCQAVAIEDAFFEEADMDFWEKEIAADFSFKHLKIVKMSCVSSEKDMAFIKFVLRCSPVLELMRVSYYIEDGNNMNIENAVLQFPRASPGVDIKFSVMPIPPIVF